MAELTYLLCAVTSFVCTTLLVRGYRSNRTKLLFCSSLCFGGLTINNVLLFVDLVMVPQIDLGIARSLTALAAMGILIYGLVWELR